MKTKMTKRRKAREWRYRVEGPGNVRDAVSFLSYAVICMAIYLDDTRQPKVKWASSVQKYMEDLLCEDIDPKRRKAGRWKC